MERQQQIIDINQFLEIRRMIMDLSSNNNAVLTYKGLKPMIRENDPNMKQPIHTVQLWKTQSLEALGTAAGKTDLL